MKLRHILALAVSGLALNASAQVVSQTFDFNNTENNPRYWQWYGNDGWTATASYESFVSYGGGPDGSTYVGYEYSGAGYEATAYRSFSAPTSSQQFSLQYSHMSGSYWGGILGVGSSVGSGLVMNANLFTGGLEFEVNGTKYFSSVDFNTTWHDFRVDIDLGANGGSGVANLFGKTSDSNTWVSLDGLSDVDLGLDVTRTATDGKNPLNWDTMWFQLVGSGSGIDNISVTAGVSAIPEPSTYAAMAGAAALGLAVWRRRSKTAQA